MHNKQDSIDLPSAVSSGTLQARRETCNQPLTLLSHTSSFVTFAMSLKSLGQHLVSDAGPEAVIRSFRHGATSSDTLLGLFADNAAEVFPAHESQGHAGDLRVADGRSRLQGMLEEGLGLNGRFCLHGGADEIVCCLDVFVWPVLAEGFEGCLDGRKIGMGWMRGVANDKDGVECCENACISTWVIACCFAGGW